MEVKSWIHMLVITKPNGSHGERSVGPTHTLIAFLLIGKCRIRIRIMKHNKLSLVHRMIKLKHNFPCESPSNTMQFRHGGKHAVYPIYVLRGLRRDLQSIRNFQRFDRDTRKSISKTWVCNSILPTWSYRYETDSDLKQLNPRRMETWMLYLWYARQRN